MDAIGACASGTRDITSAGRLHSDPLNVVGTVPAGRKILRQLGGVALRHCPGDIVQEVELLVPLSAEATAVVAAALAAN